MLFYDCGADVSNLPFGYPTVWTPVDGEVFIVAEWPTWWAEVPMSAAF